MRLQEMAARTPATRDRYVDFLRGFSIVTVVIGHWLIATIYWRGGVIYSSNVIGQVRGMWIATWFLMVMPLFFFVGGFANLVSYESFKRRGESSWEWVRTRSMRLIKPSLAFVGVWTVIQVGLHLANVGTNTGFLRGMRPPGETIPFGPLWFLPVYLYVILMAPVMIGLHRRFGLAVPVVLVAATVLVDAIGFVGRHDLVRYINVALVWLIPHQIGFFYADGRLTKLSRRGYALIALGGLAGLVLITNPPIFFGHGPQWFSGLRSYPKSMIGTGQAVANTYPPTIAMVAVSFWLIGLAMLLRDRVNSWLQRPLPWMVTIYVNSVIMTVYLWFMTAYLLAVLVLWPLGFGRDDTPTLSWWLQRPLWEIVPALFLVALVAIFGRFERPRLTRAARASP